MKVSVSKVQTFTELPVKWTMDMVVTVVCDKVVASNGVRVTAT